MSCLRKKDIGKTHKAKPKLCHGERILKKTSFWKLEPFTLVRGVFAQSLSPSCKRLFRPATGTYLSVVSVFPVENRVCFFPWENSPFHLLSEDSFCWRTAAEGSHLSPPLEGTALSHHSTVLPPAMSLLLCTSRLAPGSLLQGMDYIGGKRGEEGDEEEEEE